MSSRADGKDAEGEILLYHTRTKSRMMFSMISSRRFEMSGESGSRGGWELREVAEDDHFERMRTACHAAGVENIKGRAACRRVSCGPFVRPREASIHATPILDVNAKMTKPNRKAGERMNRAMGDSRILAATGTLAATRPPSTRTGQLT